MLWHFEHVLSQSVLTLASTVLIAYVTRSWFTILSRKLLHVGVLYIGCKNIVNMALAFRLEQVLDRKEKSTRNSVMLVSVSFLGVVFELMLLFIWSDLFHSLI